MLQGLGDGGRPPGGLGLRSEAPLLHHVAHARTDAGANLRRDLVRPLAALGRRERVHGADGARACGHQGEEAQAQATEEQATLQQDQDSGLDALHAPLRRVLLRFRAHGADGVDGHVGLLASHHGVPHEQGDLDPHSAGGEGEAELEGELEDRCLGGGRVGRDHREEQAAGRQDDGVGELHRAHRLRGVLRAVGGRVLARAAAGDLDADQEHREQRRGGDERLAPLHGEARRGALHVDGPGEGAEPRDGHGGAERRAHGAAAAGATSEEGLQEQEDRGLGERPDHA
mmetsp:Transcript_111001/g.308595  ORF Transcript_111001/g.308595 Transcript_111001/m.308595 type:complete len:286 (-) Transcript_111001:24-881(-)